jgi:hypothetical protein
MTSADAEPLSGQADCDAGASVPPVPTDAQTGADSDGDDSTVMLDVDADCRSVEADASVQRQQCAAPVLSAETDAVRASMAVSGSAWSRWRDGPKPSRESRRLSR